MALFPTSRFRLIASFLLLTSLIGWIEYGVVSSIIFQTQPNQLAWAVSLDILLGIPLLYYLLIVRPLSITPITLVGISLAAVGLASWVLPPTHHQYVRLAERLLVLAELGLVVILIRNLQKLVAVYRRLNADRFDFMVNLEQAFREVMGNLPALDWLIGELAVFRYALLGPWLPPEVRPGQLRYTLYRESGVTALGITLLLVGGIETLGIHLLVMRWQETIAWILLGLSLYSMLLVVGYLVSLRKRPTVLSADWLQIRVGFFWRADIPLESITHVERLGFAASNVVADDLARVVGSSPNLLIRLAEPVKLSGLYQPTRYSQVISLFLDEPDSFLNEVSSRKL